MDDKTTYQDTDTQAESFIPSPTANAPETVSSAPLENNVETQPAEQDKIMPEEEQVPPFCDKVFGMPRLAMYGVFLGYGGGLIATGLFKLVTGIDVQHTSIPGFIGAIIGYLICNQQVKRILAQAEAQKKAASEKES